MAEKNEPVRRNRRTRRPEFDLGPLFINVVQEYLGLRTVNKLTSNQATSIARLCNECASTIGHILDTEKDKLKPLPDSEKDPIKIGMDL